MIITNAGVYYGYSAAFTPNSGTQDVIFNVELTEDREPHLAILRKNHSRALAEGISEGRIRHRARRTLDLGTQRRLASRRLTCKSVAQAMRYPTSSRRELAAGNQRSSRRVDVRVQQRFDAPRSDLNIDRHKAMTLGSLRKKLLRMW